MEYTLETRFDIGDSVFGFVDGEIHNLVIDRIEISFERFSKTDKYTRYKVVYLATTTDCEKFNCQHRFKEGTLFTKEELKNHVNEYFENRENS
jgi:hypothetical protein